MLLLIGFLLINLCVSDAVKNLTVNQSNCRNGAKLFHRCGFIIDIGGFINEDIVCLFNFNVSNSNVTFINEMVLPKNMTNKKCPQFVFGITSSEDSFQILDFCYGTFKPVNMTFKSFVSAQLLYMDKRFIDEDFRIKMSLIVTNPDPIICTDQDKPAASFRDASSSLVWYIAIPILVAIVIAICLIYITFVRRKFPLKSNNIKTAQESNESGMKVSDPNLEKFKMVPDKNSCELLNPSESEKI